MGYRGLRIRNTQIEMFRGYLEMQSELETQLFSKFSYPFIYRSFFLFFVVVVFPRLFISVIIYLFPPSLFSYIHPVIWQVLQVDIFVSKFFGTFQKFSIYQLFPHAQLKKLSDIIFKVCCQNVKVHRLQREVFLLFLFFQQF